MTKLDIKLIYIQNAVVNLKFTTLIKANQNLKASCRTKPQNNFR